VGDINTYPQEKLILSGFHGRACLRDPASLFPAKKQFLQYTTTSPVMQKRLVPHSIQRWSKS
jgi:thioredoxin reductase (NADPH)